MKKSLIFCLVAVALILVGCKKKDAKTFEGITINQGKKLEMVQGSQVRLSMSVQPENSADPVYSFESSDPTKVSVDEDGVMYAVLLTESPVTITVTGKAVIDNETVTKTATIEVTVVDVAESFEFRDFYWMTAMESCPEEVYTVYQKRRNRAKEIADGADATIHTKKLTGDTADIMAVLPKYDEWVYLYTNEEGEEIGLFQDSVHAIRAWIVSSDIYVDAEEGSFKCAAEMGCIMETWFPFMYDKYAYVLGEREFVDDLTEMNKYVPEGQEARPAPGYLQTGHIDEDANVAWVDYMLFEGEEATGEDIWQKYDSYLRPMYSFSDGQGGTIYYPFYAMGYPTSGWLYLGQPEADQAWLAASAYDITAEVYQNAAYYCLASTEYIDEETGEPYTGYVVPHEMAETSTINYTKASEESAPAKNAVVNPNDNMRTMPKKAFETQMRVANTMGTMFRLAALRMK